MFYQARKPLAIAAILLILMVLTRGSHVDTGSSLPDATLACMLLGGIFLRRGAWFALMMMTAVAVDAYAIGVDGVSSYCLSPAYWALLPTYATLWMGGRWLAKRANAFAPLAYAGVAFLTTTMAFLISTDSFYLFSGRYPQASLWEVMQHGWEYYPAYLGYTLMYLAVAWAAQHALMLIAGQYQARNA
ncbi:MAG TPA: hypothetical protein VGK14_12100 [Novimethylophilus sp.]|jgi:hypothetical protein|uniref:hypothetical protein n=1 Tax=Novimethylophilus sp. TaxID=2137426 RepID=UPI002F40ACC5